MLNPPGAQTAPSQQQPSTYPSMQELRDAQEGFQEHPGRQGLIWQLSGPLSTAVLIKHGGNPPEPYCNRTGTNSSQWHALATSSLTEPKISSITVQVSELDHWEDDWFERHCQHSDPVGDYGPDVEWQAFPDWDPEVDEGEMQLVKCCGELRPRNKKASLTVTPARDGQGFATLHDYLSTVHPWLMSLRGELIAALSVMYDTPQESDAQLSVNCAALDYLMIETELNMFPAQSGAPPPPGAEPKVSGRTTEMGIEGIVSCEDEEVDGGSECGFGLMYLLDVCKDTECLREGDGGELSARVRVIRVRFRLCDAYTELQINQGSGGILFCIELDS